MLAAFSGAYPEVAVDLVVYDLAHPAAGLLDHGTDVALLRPPVEAPGLAVEVVASEPRVFVLASGHPLACRSSLELAEVAGLPWVAAPLSVDGCAPSAFRDDWLAVPRPGGGVAVVGAEARTIEEWREYIVAGRGIGLCPASAEAFSARPGTVFVPARGVPPTTLCVAWRADDLRPAVLGFVKVATGGSGWRRSAIMRNGTLVSILAGGQDGLQHLSPTAIQVLGVARVLTAVRGRARSVPG